MATYYVINGNASIDNGNGSFDIVAGNNSNDGLAPTRPKKDFSNLISSYTITVADTVYIAGIHVGTFTCVGQIRQWTGQSQCWILGSQDTTALGTWTNVSGTTWRINIGALVPVVNVVANWGNREDADGRHYGWYEQGTLTGTDLDNDKTWAYSSPNLYIRDTALFTGGVTPNTLSGLNAVRFCTNDDYLIGLDHRSASYTECQGINIAHYLTKVGTTYGYYGGGTVLLDSVKVYDCEIHGIVFANNPNTNSVAQFCEVWGAGTTADYNAMVWYNAGDISGARAITPKIRVYGQLDPDGVPHDATIGLNGLYAHTDGGVGNTVNDVLWSDPDIELFENPGNYYSAANPNTSISDVDDWDAYPFRVVGGFALGATTTQYLQTDIAFRWTFIDTTGTSTRSSLAIASAIFAVGSGFRVLLEGCIHVTNSDDPSSTGRRIYYLTTGSLLSQINCTTIDKASSGLYNHSMFQYQSAALFSLGSAGFQNRAKGCIFYWKNTNGTNNYFSYFDGGVANTGNYVFDGNWVNNVGTNKWAENTAYDAQSEWQSVIDTHAIIGTSPSFQDDTSVDPDVAGKPTMASALYTNLYVTNVRTSAGYNGRPYNGVRGAYQNGAEGYTRGISAAARLLLKAI